MSLLSRLRDLRYREDGRRDLRLDLIRGMAALAMIVDHVGGRESWFYAITGGDRFFVSAAEVFVLVSGITAGVVYRSALPRIGIAGVIRKALRRTALLYVLTTGLTFGFVAVSVLLVAPWRLVFQEGEILPWMWSIVTMQRTYYLADILLVYVLLLAILGPVVAGLARGWTWAVLAGSWGLWLAWQIAPGWAELPWTIQNNPVFKFNAWQVIFVTGVVMGYHRRAIAARTARLWPWPAFVASAAAAAVLIAMFNGQTGAGQWFDPGAMIGSEFAGKADVRIGRLIALATFFTLGLAVTTVAWRPIAAASGRLLLPLGQHALTAYALHLFVIAVIEGVLPTWDVERPVWQTTAIQLMGLLTVWSAIVLWTMRGAAPEIRGPELVAEPAVDEPPRPPRRALGSAPVAHHHPDPAGHAARTRARDRRP